MNALFKIVQPFYSLWGYLVFFLYIIFAIIWTPILVIVYGKKKALPKIMAYYRGWSYLWGALTLNKYDFKGYENIEKGKAYVITGSHSSTLDMFACAAAPTMPFVTLAKAELAKIPLLGYLFSVASIFVDRSSEESRKKSVQKMEKVLNDGTSILIMPEGTRNRTKAPLKEFQNGAFRVAIETQTPILPMVILHCRALMKADSIMMKPGTIGVKFLPPVTVDRLTEDDIPMLKDKVYKMMEDVILKEDAYFKGR